jgi:NAD-dependent dihydropyrimidine dehydrogenase PreA subunit
MLTPGFLLTWEFLSKRMFHTIILSATPGLRLAWKGQNEREKENGRRGRDSGMMPKIIRPEKPQYSWLDIDRRKCNHCGLCVEMCPMDVLRLGAGKVPFMRYRDDCWYCDVCVEVCPRNAISMNNLPYLIR